MSNLKKYGNLLKTSGIVCLIVSVAMFVAVEISLGSFENVIGYKMSVNEAQVTIKESEEMLEWFGGSLSELIGVSEFQLALFQFSVPLRIPMLVIGLVLWGAGFALQYIKTDSIAFDSAKDNIANGVSQASSALKKFVDTATVKCPKCGKICTGNTAFCPQCGEKTVKNEIVSAAKKMMSPELMCEKCGDKYRLGNSFCPKCGSKLVPIVETIAATGCYTEAAVPREELVMKPVLKERAISHDKADTASTYMAASVPVSMPEEYPADVDTDKSCEDLVVKESVAQVSVERANPFMKKAGDL